VLVCETVHALSQRETPVTVKPLPDEKETTAAAFLARAKIWFAAHGSAHIHVPSP
jgi:hypothetical protein